MSTTTPRHYVGEVGVDIIVNIGEDLTSAISTKLIVKKPDGAVVNWTAPVYSIGSLPYYLKYTTIIGDLELPGKYEVQPQITLASGWSGYGTTSYFVIQSLFA